MFDKNKFSRILKDISDTFENQREFSKKADVNRTYLSKYINMKIDVAPKPEILRKIANNSKGITTYEELMQVCGYINPPRELSLVEQVYNENIYKLDKFDLSNSDYEYLKKVFISKNDSQSSIESQLNTFSSNFPDALELYNILEDIYITISNILSNYKASGMQYPIPVYDNIDIGNIDSSIEGNISRYINLEIEINKIFNLTNYFAIKAIDNSMSPLLDVGDIAIINKNQDFISGRTYLLKFKDNIPIIRKIIEVNETFELQAMNMWNFPPQKDIKKEACATNTNSKSD